MKHLLRSLAIALVASLGLSAFAQPVPPYDVTVAGVIVGCTPNSFVNVITVQGTQPSLDIDIPVDPNFCTFSVTLPMDSYQGWFQLSTPCQGAMQTQSVAYTVNALNPDSSYVYVVFNCGGVVDCLGVPGGSTLPGTPCNTPAGNEGLYDANCNCVETSTAVDACISMVQTAPFSAVFSSCTTGGTTPYDLLWDFSDGGAVAGDDIAHTYPGPGAYAVCLNVTDADGFFDSTCETIYVDDNGNISLDPPTNCLACLNVVPQFNGNTPIPFAANFVNCSTGSQSITFNWWMPDGSNSTQANESFIFPGEGVYGVCLTIADGSGCTSTICDTVIVDPNGGINTVPVWYDCLGILWGSNTAGTPCQQGGLVGTWDSNCNCVPNTPVDCEGVPGGNAMPGTPCSSPAVSDGTWSADCECVPNNPTGCEAGFWVIQAYEIDSLNPNGGATPIPNELWIWNLSSGTTGNYQFLWNFGDGTSSTEAYPTHFYPNGGPYLLCLTMWDGNCTDTYCDSIAVDEDGLYSGIMLQENYARSGFTINVLSELPTGLEEQTALENANLWPNPVTDAFTLSFQSTFSGNVPLSIYDMNGRVMHQENLAFNRGGNRIDLGAHQLAPGMYLLRVGEGANAMNIRFIKN